MEETAPPPDAAVAEKLWRGQMPGTTRWRLESPFTAAHNFSLLALVCCEIQAVDQHWSLHRTAASLPDGARDEDLAASFAFSRAVNGDASIGWHALDAVRCRELLGRGLEAEVADHLASIRARQEHHLRRELDRVEDYFENYERELGQRAGRSRNENTKLKVGERLAAARAEHQRRRADQVQRHEIRVLPHFAALLIVAESAWRANVAVTPHSGTESVSALFVPRLRRWM